MVLVACKPVQAGFGPSFRISLAFKKSRVLGQTDGKLGQKPEGNPAQNIDFPNGWDGVPAKYPCLSPAAQPMLGGPYLPDGAYLCTSLLISLVYPGLPNLPDSCSFPFPGSCSLPRVERMGLRLVRRPCSEPTSYFSGRVRGSPVPHTGMFKCKAQSVTHHSTVFSPSRTDINLAKTRGRYFIKFFIKKLS